MGILSYRFRINPNKMQSALLAEMLADFCELYNAALEHRVVAHRKGVNIHVNAQMASLPAIRRDLPHIKRWSCTAEQQVMRKLDKTFKAFFARVKCGLHAGFPRFKATDRYHAADFRVGDGLTIRKNNKIRIAGVLGDIKVRWHRHLPSRPTSGIISRNAGKWYVIFHVEVATVDRASTESIGIDLGLSCFAAMSDGGKVTRQRITKRNAAKLRRLQRALARAKQGSKMRGKRRTAVAKHYAYIASSRRDFSHKESRKLVNRFGRIAFEDLNIKKLAQSMLAKEVKDAAWAQFVSLVSYKAENAGCEVKFVDSRGTSQTCPECGATAAKTLAEREHRCDCGCSLDRDVAAAIVVHQRAFGFPPGMGGGSLSQRVAA